LRSAHRKGLTLVEILASTALIAIALTSAIGALGSVAKTQSRERSVENLERMALDKYRTVQATYDLTQTSFNGDFQDESIDGYTWAANLQASSDQNLDWMTLTVTDSKDSTRTYSVTGLVYVPAATTTTAAPTTGAGTGGARPGGTTGGGTTGGGRPGGTG
jgi:prepilin-type N-terminal cleavage/methylation domain-containing protein